MEGIPPLIKALREAIKAGDALTVETVAHTIKGSCGNMGATGMSTICAELEGVGRSGELEHAPVLVDRLEVEFERVRSALEGEMEERSG